MRLGLVCYPGLGGSGVVASELAARLAERGHRVVMIATERPFRLDDPRVEFFPVELPSYPVYPHPFYTLALAGAIRQAGQKFGLEAIHTHYAIPHVVAAELAESGAALVHTLHGTDVNQLGLDPLYREITARALVRAGGVSAVSGFLARQAQAVFGIRPAVIPNAVDLNRFYPRPRASREGFVLLHASNFRPIKRVPDIVRVFAKVAVQAPAKLLLLGDGPERPEAARVARDLGVAERVCFLDPVPHPELIIAEADLFLLHSQEESFGLAALEALASGVPVVAARVGGLAEVVINGQTGILTELGDLEAQAEAILSLLADSARIQAMGQAGRADAETRFNPARVTTCYEQFYAQALAAKSVNPD